MESKARDKVYFQEIFTIKIQKIIVGFLNKHFNFSKLLQMFEYRKTWHLTALHSTIKQTSNKTAFDSSNHISLVDDVFVMQEIQSLLPALSSVLPREVKCKCERIDGSKIRGF